MQGTRFKSVTREALGNILREIKIALTPVPKPDKWVFIVGCYNSGTTLLAEMMSRHPDMSSLPTEGHFITDQFPKDYELGIPRMWVDREDLFCLDENSSGPDLVRIKKEWGMRLDLSKKVLIEKSPPNVARMRWLNKHFENAHFIGLVRNGYAVAEGISRKGDPGSIKEGWPIEKSAYQWARSNEVLLDNANHIENFSLITYEELTQSPQQTLNKIASFIGVKPFPQMDEGEALAIHERKDAIKNMNDLSIQKLTASEISTINDVAGDMLKKLNYPIIGQPE